MLFIRYQVMRTMILILVFSRMRSTPIVDGVTSRLHSLVWSKLTLGQLWGRSCVIARNPQVSLQRSTHPGPARRTFLTAARVLIIGISAATGTCFAVLAGLSISAMAVPVRRFHVASIVLAAVAICLGWLSFRAAMAGVTDEKTEETVVAPLLRGIVGAFVGLIFIVAVLLMFGPDARGFLAHAVGKPTSSFTPIRLLAAAVLLGFGTGFVVRLPSATKQPPTTGNMTRT